MGKKKTKPFVFILHWKDNTTQEVSGSSIADAITKAGYGAGALRALDYYEAKTDGE